MHPNHTRQPRGEGPGDRGALWLFHRWATDQHLNLLLSSLRSTILCGMQPTSTQSSYRRPMLPWITEDCQASRVGSAFAERSKSAAVYSGSCSPEWMKHGAPLPHHLRWIRKALMVPSIAEIWKLSLPVDSRFGAYFGRCILLRSSVYLGSWCRFLNSGLLLISGSPGSRCW
jgi:hypothetical protein